MLDHLGVHCAERTKTCAIDEVFNAPLHRPDVFFGIWLGEGDLANKSDKQQIVSLPHDMGGEFFGAQNAFLSVSFGNSLTDTKAGGVSNPVRGGVA